MLHRLRLSTEHHERLSTEHHECLSMEHHEPVSIIATPAHEVMRSLATVSAGSSHSQPRTQNLMISTPMPSRVTSEPF